MKENTILLAGEDKNTLMDLLTGYDWPGYVRELGNVIERAVVLACGDTVTHSCLPERLTAGKSGETKGAVTNGYNLPEMERALLQQALRRNHGNQSAAARELGISRKRLRTKVGRHGMLNNSSA